MPLRPSTARPVGIAIGVVADLVLADPRRGHPVAAFGRGALALERRLYADHVGLGIVHTTVAVGAPVLVGGLLERWAAERPLLRTTLTAAATWAVLGGTSLAREGRTMGRRLEAGDLSAARAGLSSLCARDPSAMDAEGLARATVESLAENASDAVVAPLLWGAVAGVPGLLGYRAANTLDAMVGYRSPRYLRFGRASARLDDLVNLIPARVTGLLVVACAPVVGGSVTGSWRALRRDAGRHPSPNAGRPEAATAGALGVRLGGANVYHGRLETRPYLGDGSAPRVSDVARAVRLGRSVSLVAAGVAVAVAACVPHLTRGRVWHSGARPVHP